MQFIINALKSVKGAVDMASIMVGVIVLGILGAGTAATVFGVIPWSQDHSAKSIVETVRTAEQSYYAKEAKYGTAEQLVDRKVLQSSEGAYAAVNATSDCFLVGAKSRTGTIWFATNRSEKPQEYTTSSTASCGNLNQMVTALN